MTKSESVSDVVFTDYTLKTKMDNKYTQLKQHLTGSS